MVTAHRKTDGKACVLVDHHRMEDPTEDSCIGIGIAVVEGTAMDHDMPDESEGQGQLLMEVGLLTMSGFKSPIFGNFKTSACDGASFLASSLSGSFTVEGEEGPPAKSELCRRLGKLQWS